MVTQLLSDDMHNIDGKHLDPLCRNGNDQNRVPDYRLQEHASVFLRT